MPLILGEGEVVECESVSLVWPIPWVCSYVRHHLAVILDVSTRLTASDADASVLLMVGVVECLHCGRVLCVNWAGALHSVGFLVCGWVYEPVLLAYSVWPFPRAGSAGSIPLEFSSSPM